MSAHGLFAYRLFAYRLATHFSWSVASSASSALMHQPFSSMRLSELDVHEVPYSSFFGVIYTRFLLLQ